LPCPGNTARNSRTGRSGLLDGFTRYGTRTHRVAMAMLILVGVGLAVFSLPASSDGIQPQNSGGPNTAVTTGAAQPGAAAPPRRPVPDTPSFVDRLVYDIDLFLPIDLQSEDRWQPDGDTREVYAAFHEFAGWVLIPLFLASLTGLLTRR